MGRYLEVWCKVIGLKWGTEASCTIRQISYCLMGEGALGDVGVIAILLQAGRSYICKLLQSHAYKQKQTITLIKHKSNIEGRSCFNYIIILKNKDSKLRQQL